MNEAHDPNQTADFPQPPSDPLDAGLAAGFARRVEGPESVVSKLQPSLGDLRPVLLKEAKGDSADIVKPKSDAIPSPEQTGDRYQLQGEIARGGMGAVLRGRDVDLGRDLAVKVLLEKYVNRPDVARRFLEEAQIGGQLQHPGVVPVYGIGYFGARPYFTMKLVKGKTLAALLSERDVGHVSNVPADEEARWKRAPQDLPRFLDIALKVAQTLAYAHDKGVIHRDLKPANIMVGAFGEVQVMDWGLAKVLAEGGIADEVKASRERQRPEDVTTIRTARSSGSGFGTDTEAGSLLGTPAYMPPEQANGEISNLDRRADVFGLGAILCEILTGQPPYVGSSGEEVRRLSANGNLADAHARLEKCGADQELIALTKACLSAEPVDRPRDAQAVADTMQAYLDGVQQRLHQAELAEAEAKAKAIEEVKRRRLTLALAATVLLAVTVGGGGWLWVKNEQDARAAQTAREVHDALNQATALREKAKSATTGAAALFAQAREQVSRALALVESAGAAGNEALKQQVRQLQGELDEEEKDRKLIAALEEARLAQAETVAGENRFATERAVPRFREAFREYGLVAGEGTPQAAAERIRQRPAAVREAIVATLDEWNELVDNPNHGITEPDREWLRAVRAAAEPEDDWGRLIWAARAEHDNDKRRAALQQLATSADVATVPARALTRLANQLDRIQRIALLRRAQAHYPADFWVNHDLAWALREATPPEYAEAVRFLTAAVALRPNSPGCLINLGVVLYDKHELDEAIACWRKAIELDPSYAAAHNNLGNALHGEGQEDEAIACYKKAIELDPRNALAHSNMANSFQARGAVDEAIACLRKAIELEPKLAAAYTNLGRALKAKDQVDEAIACFRKAIELDPNSALAHNGLGAALCNFKRDFDGAIASFDKAIELNPNDAVAHFNLGNALYLKGHVDEAIASWKKAIEFDPKDAAAHYSLGDALRGKGQIDEAIACFRKAIELDAKDAAAHNSLGALLCDVKKDFDGAIASFKYAIELDPNNAAAHDNLGNALRGNGQIDEAIACYNKALALDPKFANAHNNLGKARYAIGKVDEAMACYRNAIVLDPKFANAHNNLGAALARKGQLDEAIACYQRAIALAPKDAEAHFNLGNALDGKGQLDQAIACYKTAIELEPNHAEIHCNLGSALQRRGRFAESLAALKRGHELGSKQPGWAYPSAQWVREAEGMAAMESKLTAFLKGDFQPKDAAECLGLAGVCQVRKLQPAATRLYAAAFAADPRLVDDPTRNYRYNAACSAALASAGKSVDTVTLDNQEKARLRKQARDWLRADLALRTKQLESGQPADRDKVRQEMKHWQEDPDLAGIRDAAAVAKLPAEERATCEMLWADVVALLEKAEATLKEDK